jgi:hypothetical protein
VSAECEVSSRLDVIPSYFTYTLAGCAGAWAKAKQSLPPQSPALASAQEETFTCNEIMLIVID